MERYTRKATDVTRIFTTHMTVNELKRAVTKATLDEPTRPRMKDVQKIIDATFLRPTPHNTKCGPHKVLKYLQQRLHAGEWPVVLKALLLCHILLDEGSRGMIDLLLHSPFVFNLQDFRDASIPSAYDYSSYTRLFARYLQERIVTIRTLGMPYDTIREPSRNQQTAVLNQEFEDKPVGHIASLDIKEVLKVMPVLENQLEVLSDVRLRSEELHVDLTIGVLERVMKDMLPLMNQLTQGVEMIQENFFIISKHQCEASLKIYQTYIELIEKANTMLTIANRLGATENNITLEHAPLDYAKGMEEHIATLSEDGRSSDTASEKRSHVESTSKSSELHKALSNDYDEEAALAAAIKASLQDSGQSSMISFDDDSDDEEYYQEEQVKDSVKRSPNSIDDFFGVDSDTNNTKETKDKEKQSSSKPKPSDDLLELLSGIHVDDHKPSNASSMGVQGLVPPMPPSSSTKQNPSVGSTQQQPGHTQQWNTDTETQASFQNLQGYYSTVGSMNTMPMFPSQQGMNMPMAPNMMTPYITYGGPGSWPAMPPPGYPPGMYMQYNSMGGWNPNMSGMQPMFYPPSYGGPRIPGTAHSPPEYDSSANTGEGNAPSDFHTATASSVASKEKRQDPVFSELNPLGYSSKVERGDSHQNEKHWEERE
eukprot:jgi/Galph1/5679/GphlegSOOS_G4332.1